MMGEYAPFVISAYAIAFAAIGAVLLWAVLDRRAAKSALSRAERAVERARGQR